LYWPERTPRFDFFTEPLIQFCNVLRPLLFCDVTQCRLVVTDVSGEPVQEYCLKDCLDLEDRTEELSGNVGD